VAFGLLLVLWYFIKEMNELETRVGKISFSSKKLSKSYVSVVSEKLPENGAELFAIIELPNKVDGGVWQDYEKIQKIITSALRSNFRNANPNSFENCLAQINSGLAEEAAEGAASWLVKINALVSVRYLNDFYISTVGKIHAYLFRNKQFSNIADSPSKTNPAKLFENFVIGKLTKNDTVILTTSTLIDYVSMDRLQQELSEPEALEESTQLIADLIEESAGKDLSLGTLFLGIGLGEKLSPEKEISRFESSSLDKSKRILQVIGTGAKNTLQGTSKYIVSFASGTFNRIKNADIKPSTIKDKTAEIMSPEKFRALSKTKKFFLSMAALFFVLLVTDIVIGIRVGSTQKKQKAIDTTFSDITNYISQANDAQVYGDSEKSRTLLSTAQKEMSSLSSSTIASTQGQQVEKQLTQLEDAVNKINRVSPTQLINFGMNVDRIIRINNIIYAVNYKGSAIASYDTNSKKLTSSKAMSTSEIVAASSSGTGMILIEDKNGVLFLYDPTKQTLQQQKATLPAGTVGLSTFFTSPIKAYTVNPNTNGGIISGFINNTKLSTTAGNFSGAMDIATDGTGEYILLNNNILKFASGQSRPFTISGFTFSQGSKIFLGTANCYIADLSGAKIISTDKSGNLVAQYAPGAISQINDLTVNEQQKTAYFISGSILYSFGM